MDRIGHLVNHAYVMHHRIKVSHLGPNKLLFLWSSLSQAVGALRRGDLQQTFPLWQLRLVVELWDSRMLRGPAYRHDTLLTSEFLPVMKNAVDVALDNWLKGEDTTGNRMDGWMDEWMKGWMDGWMDGEIFEGTFDG